MNYDYFNSHYDVLNKLVAKAAWQWYSYAKSAYVPIIQVLDIDDVKQQIWTEVLEMPDFLPIELYAEFGVTHASIELGKLFPRFWHGISRGSYIQQIPLEEDSLECQDTFSPAGIEERIGLSIDLIKTLTPDEHNLYINYLQFNRELNPKEKGNKRTRADKIAHMTGWTQGELADIYCVSVATIERRIRKIKDEVKRILKEYGIAKSKEIN